MPCQYQNHGSYNGGLRESSGEEFGGQSRFGESGLDDTFRNGELDSHFGLDDGVGSETFAFEVDGNVDMEWLEMDLNHEDSISGTIDSVLDDFGSSSLDTTLPETSFSNLEFEWIPDLPQTLETSGVNDVGGLRGGSEIEIVINSSEELGEG